MGDNLNMKEQIYSGTRNSEISERELHNRTLARRAAAEGMVLLKNEGVLPLKKETKLALYGAGARYTIKGGTGSGAVNNRSNVSIDEGLRNAGFVITNDEWLDQYDQEYDAAREAWIAKIYELAGPGKDFDRLYRAHASNPMIFPQGPEITKTEADTAIMVVSRISGEGADRKEEKGDYYLSDAEQEMLAEIEALYEHVIVILNVGGIVDLSFLEEYQVDGLVLMSQAGMEGGNALADVLSGAVNPSGKLTDTWAYQYSDYPGSAEFSHNNGNVIEEYYKEGIYVGYRYFDSFGVEPRYCFGYGLSYTEFAVEMQEYRLADQSLEVNVKVTNTGKAAGKEVVQLYVACPDGKLKKEEKRLMAFAKTKELVSGESQILTLAFDLDQLESYHSGKRQYLVEAGMYLVRIGTAANQVKTVLGFKLAETVVTAKVDGICPLVDALPEIEPQKHEGGLSEDELTESVPILEISAANIKTRKIHYFSIEEEKQDQYTELANKLTLEQAAALVCGRPTSESADFIGNAAITVPGAAGETTGLLYEEYGVPNIVMADGPAGIRIYSQYDVNPDTGKIYELSRYEGLENRIFGKQFCHEGAVTYYQYCSAIPVGTLLAQSFNLELMEEVGDTIGGEMEEFGIKLWLAPGMNIHRNPFCGRNFEYYSEDPFVSGKMAAAVTRGVQKHPGLGTTIKHFACNNQEENRRGVSSIVSERALREIYLKGFEIAVKESQPMAIMTSYNKINGVHTANSYDLCTKAARDEWGFAGIIMTDWTTTNDGGGSSAAKCLEAGNDLIMPGRETDIQEILDAVREEGRQYLDERYLRRCAANMLRMICGE